MPFWNRKCISATPVSSSVSPASLCSILGRNTVLISVSFLTERSFSLITLLISPERSSNFHLINQFWSCICHNTKLVQSCLNLNVIWKHYFICHASAECFYFLHHACVAVTEPSADVFVCMMWRGVMLHILHLLCCLHAVKWGGRRAGFQQTCLLL